MLFLRGLWGYLVFLSFHSRYNFPPRHPSPTTSTTSFHQPSMPCHVNRDTFKFLEACVIFIPTHYLPCILLLDTLYIVWITASQLPLLVVVSISVRNLFLSAVFYIGCNPVSRGNWNIRTASRETKKLGKQTKFLRYCAISRDRRHGQCTD